MASGQSHSHRTDALPPISQGGVRIRPDEKKCAERFIHTSGIAANAYWGQFLKAVTLRSVSRQNLAEAKIAANPVPSSDSRFSAYRTASERESDSCCLMSNDEKTSATAEVELITPGFVIWSMSCRSTTLRSVGPFATSERRQICVPYLSSLQISFSL